MNVYVYGNLCCYTHTYTHNWLILYLVKQVAHIRVRVLSNCYILIGLINMPSPNIWPLWFLRHCIRYSWKRDMIYLYDEIKHILYYITRHVFVKHGCPLRQQSQHMAKISKSYILTPPLPQGCVMSVKCEKPIDELTVQVWLLYHHPNFEYCTLFVRGTELRTNGQTDGWTDGRSKH